MSNLADKPATYQIRALDRGLDVLEAFTPAQPEMGIGELATATGIPKPTIVRLLSVLAERGYVERDEASDRYRVGVRTLELGSTYLQSTSLENEAKPIMNDLVHATNQTANLGVLQNGDVVHVQVVAPDRPVRFWASVGTRDAAYYCGLGKAMLAALDDSEIVQYLHRDLVAKTPKTLTDPEELRQELQRIRRNGYAIDDEESSLGVRCVAAPVRNSLGKVVAALSISGLKAEFSEDHLDPMVQEVVKAAEKVSARLGAV